MRWTHLQTLKEVSLASSGLKGAQGKRLLVEIKETQSTHEIGIHMIWNPQVYINIAQLKTKLEGQSTAGILGQCNVA